MVFEYIKTLDKNINYNIIIYTPGYSTQYEALNISEYIMPNIDITYNIIPDKRVISYLDNMNDWTEYMKICVYE